MGQVVWGHGRAEGQAVWRHGSAVRQALWGHGRAVGQAVLETRERRGTESEHCHPLPPIASGRARAGSSRLPGLGALGGVEAELGWPIRKDPASVGGQSPPVNNTPLREAGKGRGERLRRPIRGRETRANPSAGRFGRSFQNG